MKRFTQIQLENMSDKEFLAILLQEKADKLHPSQAFLYPRIKATAKRLVEGTLTGYTQIKES